MKKITLVLLALLLVVSCIGLAACNNNAQKILDAYLLDQDEQLVDKDFVLPAKIQDQAVTWTSDNDAVQIEKRTDDYLAKVNLGDEVTAVKLTVTLGNASKTFTVRVAALDVYYLADQYVFTKENATVYEDFTLDRTFTFAGKTANISWTVDDSYSDYLTISEDGNTCVVFPTSLNPQVRIKATFTYGDETTTVSYKLTVGLQRSALEEINYWYYNTDVSVEIKGYVVAVADPYSEQFGNVSLYVLDEEFVGGYYAYRVKTDAENGALIEPGAYVTITGTTNTNYNGLVETNAGGNLVVDTTKDKIDVTDYVYAIDQDILGNVPGAIYHQSRLVSLTNWTVKSVATTAPEAGSTDTLFTLEKGGVEVPVVVSKYLKGVYDTAEGDATWEALCALQGTVKVGDVVSVTGLLGNYNGAQIMPFSAEDVKTGGTADPADTVYPGQTAAKAIEEVNKTLTDNKVDARITKATEFTLPTTSNGVEIAYELCRDSKSVVIEEGKFTVTPGKHELSTVKVTYTVKDGETVVYTTAQFFDIESLVPTLDTMIDEIEVPPMELREDYKLDENATWTVKTGTGIEIVDGIAKVTRTDKDQAVVLTATVTLNGESKSRDYYVTVIADPYAGYVPEVIETPAAGTYKLFMEQANLGKNLYFTGEMNGYYYATSEDAINGVDIVVTAGTAENTYTLSFVNKEGVTKYLSIADDGSHINVLIGDTPYEWTWEAERNIITATLGDTTYFLGTYGNYNTISASKVSYIEDASDIGKSQFVARFVTFKKPADADKVSVEKNALAWENTTYTEDGTATLPLVGETYGDVTIAWTADNASVVIDGANFALTMPAASARIVVTATLTCGEATDTKQFVLFAVVDVLDAVKLMQEGDKLNGTFSLTGTVKSIDEAYSDEFKNVTLTITVGDTDIQCYRMKGDAAATAKFGDELVVTGSLENYKGAVRFSSGANGVFVDGGEGGEGGEDPVVTPEHAGTVEDPYTVADALIVAGALAEGDYSEKVYITGTVKSIGSYDSYLRNVYLTDAEGKELLVYSVNYSDTITEVYPNDTVVISGYLTNYYGTLEVSSYQGDYAEFTSRTAGESTVTFTNDAHATVENLSRTEGLNGTTFTFTVQVSEGFQIVSVKVNGETVEAVEGTYTGTIKGNTTITLETAEEGVSLTTVTKTIAELATANSWENGTKVANPFTLDEVITVSYNGGSNTGKYYSSNQSLRLYSSESGSITFTAAEGYQIATIAIEYNDSNTALENNETKLASGVAFTVNGTSVSFVATKDKPNITSITITYVAV